VDHVFQLLDFTVLRNTLGSGRCREGAWDLVGEISSLREGVSLSEFLHEVDKVDYSFNRHGIVHGHTYTSIGRQTLELSQALLGTLFEELLLEVGVAIVVRADSEHNINSASVFSVHNVSVVTISRIDVLVKHI